MTRFFNIGPIVWDHFRPFRFGEKRQTSFQHIAVFLVIPILFGVALSFWKPAGARSQQAAFMTAYSLVAAVMLALLPVVQSILGFTPIDRERVFLERDKPLWREQVIRLQVLRELYSEISFAVLILVVSLAPAMAAGASALPLWALQGLSAFVYSVGFSAAIACVHIMTNVYLVLDAQAKEATRFLDKANPDAAHPSQENRMSSGSSAA
ncbi:MAG TPA: hypothetical protein VGN72_06670 [Tepidisphaeraceae bacterium]|jgi:hypothetical protein|nr:hypothetical protein [Tepidisphaeraceae bacterium]